MGKIWHADIHECMHGCRYLGSYWQCMVNNYRDIEINITEVIDTFSKRYPRRMQL